LIPSHPTVGASFAVKVPPLNVPENLVTFVRWSSAAEAPAGSANAAALTTARASSIIFLVVALSFLIW
jgi:hypothetical protein